MSSNGHQNDFVGAGFQRLPKHTLNPNPPKINWGHIYRKKSLKERLRLAERTAAAMNDAAAKIQVERNQLNDLLHLKERQLQEAAKAVAANNEMLQTEVTRMNEDRHAMLDEMAKLKSKIRELESGDHD